ELPEVTLILCQVIEIHTEIRTDQMQEKIMRKLFAGLISLIAVLAVAAVSTLAQTRHPITFDDLISVKRVGDAQFSPDGKMIAYTVTVYNKATNGKNSDIW